MILGITGGIATGKSTVASMFQTAAYNRGRGLILFSADAIARDLLDPGAPYTLQVLDHFGPGFALPEEPQAVDRSRLARRIFANAADRYWLEALLHPPIIHQLDKDLEPFRTASGRDVPGVLIAAEIPLLYERQLEWLVDKILVTYCLQPTQVSRIRSRRADISDGDALLQIAAQIPIDDKIARADYVIDTDQPLDRVAADVDHLFDTLTAGEVQS